ncbi:hypothetical protein TIFTF001_016922 [Ficus carica]|uniref:Uncharacterized protein n=1 Tax=Ficus carica TaxID=3494 RepID=A0AA88DIX8_FICCA|nr:hypothetical protein TIFTF001_016922 [Ficus carica]
MVGGRGMEGRERGRGLERRERGGRGERGEGGRASHWCPASNLKRVVKRRICGGRGGGKRDGRGREGGL